jgi:hypothetical protein
MQPNHKRLAILRTRARRRRPALALKVPPHLLLPAADSVLQKLVKRIAPLEAQSSLRPARVVRVAVKFLRLHNNAVAIKNQRPLARCRRRGRAHALRWRYTASRRRHRGRQTRPAAQRPMCWRAGAQTCRRRRRKGQLHRGWWLGGCRLAQWRLAGERGLCRQSISDYA